VRLFRAHDLLTKRQYIGAKRIERRCGEVVAVINGVYGGEGILGRKVVVEPGGAEIFANRLQRAAENLGDTAEIEGAGGRRGPEIQKRLNAGNGGSARRGVRNEGGGGLVKMLAKTFVIGEEKSLIRAKRAAGGGAELVALERRGGALVEKVGGVQCVVAEEFEDGAVPLIGAGLREDYNLAAGMFAEFGAVRVSLHVEFADGVHAEQHAAGATGLHIVFGGAGVLDAVEEKEILLRAVTLDGKVIAGGGIGNAGAARFLRGEIYDTGIEREKKVVAAPVKREFPDLTLADEAGDVIGGWSYNRSLGNSNLLFHSCEGEPEIHMSFLPNDQMNAAAN